MIYQEGHNGPDQREHADDEEDEDEVGRKGVVFHKAVDEPRENADGGDESYDLGETPEGEEEAG